MKFMALPRVYRAIGLMSGTSLDGVDVALVETDGRDYAAPEESFYLPYDSALREKIRACFGQTERTPEIAATEKELTLAHAQAVRMFLLREGLDAADIDVIGFHGQTITHDPARGFTWQLGDGALLARETGIDVVNDFRDNDVRAGGQGAPLLPLYHRARAVSPCLPRPVAILNIGGVANLTWIGEGADDILAFDTGPGNALIDDAVLRETGKRFDEDGKLARAGRVQEDLLQSWMDHPFFAARPPKSLDRNAWQAKGQMSDAETLPLPDRIATLTAFTVRSVLRGAEHFPAPVRAVYVAGGGRLNAMIMAGLAEGFDGVSVRKVDDLGWNGDALEAEGFAYLAARSLEELPLSLPGTTSVPRPVTGGVLHKKSA
jgi:anhydro-N-acetylmuramic acid kinase